MIQESHRRQIKGRTGQSNNQSTQRVTGNAKSSNSRYYKSRIIS